MPVSAVHHGPRIGGHAPRFAAPSMSTVTRILLGASLCCFLAWGAALLLGVRLLAPAQELQVIYGEHEDFYSDALVLRRRGNVTSFLLHCPRARPAYRWWTVDFANLTISSASPPRTFRSWQFLIAADLEGKNIADLEAMGEWNWHFTDAGASFSGKGFTCSIRRTVSR